MGLRMDPEDRDRRARRGEILQEGREGREGGAERAAQSFRSETKSQAALLWKNTEGLILRWMPLSLAASGPARDSGTHHGRNILLSPSATTRPGVAFHANPVSLL